MENAVCNLGAIGPILNKAGHPGTFDTEALTFIRHAHKLCDKAGLSLSDMIGLKKDSDQFAALSTMPMKAYLDNMADLELLVATRDAEITHLRMAAAEKDARIASLEAIPSDPVRIAELEKACASRSSQVEELKSHVAAIQERLREKEAQRERAQRDVQANAIDEKVDVRPVNDADDKDHVQVDALDEEIDAGSPGNAQNGKAPAASAAPEFDWTDTAKAKLIEYASNGVSAATIGRRLAREFGERVTPSVVAAMLRRLLIADAEGFLWAPHWR